jgi:hypothetical protein
LYFGTFCFSKEGCLIHFPHFYSYRSFAPSWQKHIPKTLNFNPSTKHV